MSQVRRSAIGLDLGRHTLKAVQIGRSRDGVWHLEAVVAVRRTSPGEPLEIEELSRLRRRMKSCGFVGRRVVAAPNRERMFSAVMDLPPRHSGAPRDQIARTELACVANCSSQAMEADWWELAGARGREGARAMAVGCLHTEADTLIDLLIGSGFEVAALDAPSTALGRVACSVAGSDECDEQTAAMLDLGWSGATLVIRGGRTIIYDRHLPDFALSSLWERLQDGLQLDSEVVDYLLYDVGLRPPASVPELQGAAAGRLARVQSMVREHFQPLGRELTAAFSYASHQSPDGKQNLVQMLGGGAGIPQLDQFLRGEVEASVQTVRLDRITASRPHLKHVAEHPAIGAAVGLALHGEERSG